MNDHYRTPAALHERLLTGESRRPNRGPALRLAGAAACCGLILAGCLWGIRLVSGFPGPGVEPVAAGTPAQTEPAGQFASPPLDTQPPAPTEAPASGKFWPEELRDYVLRIEDPFDGQPHGDFVLPGVEFTQCASGGIMVDYALGEESRTETQLTPEEMLHLLGGTDQAPWSLYWAGFELTGRAVFGEEAELLEAVVSGERGDTTIGLTLTPGQLPPEDVIYGEVEEQVYALNAAAVKAYYIDLENGEYLYRAECMSGETGVRLDVTASDREEAAHLILCFLRAAAGWEMFTTEGVTLQEEHIRSLYRKVTLEEAYGDALGAYLPRYVPEEFGIDFASRSETRKGSPAVAAVSAAWSGGYSYISVTVQQFAGRDVRSAVSDLQCLNADEISPEALTAEGIGRYVDTDRGDQPGWRFSFLVEYPGEDGEAPVYAQYSIKGLDPRQAAAVVTSCARSMCTGLPLPPTPSPAAEDMALHAGGR